MLVVVRSVRAAASLVARARAGRLAGRPPRGLAGGAAAAALAGLDDEAMLLRLAAESAARSGEGPAGARPPVSDEELIRLAL